MRSIRPDSFLLGLVLTAASAGVLPRAAFADVRDAAANGFTVAFSAKVPAAPGAVWDAIVKDVGAWWDPDHTYSGNSANLSIEAVPGGCFCEKLAGGFVRHLDVVYADAGKLLRMSGGLGPLQSMADAGTLTFTMSTEPGGAALAMTYAAGGYNPGGFEAIAPLVDSVLGGQFARLVAHLGGETGETAEPSAK